MDTRLERASLNWTRSANSHTGRRHSDRIRGRTHVSTRPRSKLIRKILLASTGASTHVHKDSSQQHASFGKAAFTGRIRRF